MRKEITLFIGNSINNFSKNANAITWQGIADYIINNLKLPIDSESIQFVNEKPFTLSFQELQMRTYDDLFTSIQEIHGIGDTEKTLCFFSNPKFEELWKKADSFLVNELEGEYSPKEPHYDFSLAEADAIQKRNVKALLKAIVAKMLSKLETNDYHRKYMEELDIKNVITTNYDFCLEATINDELHFYNNDDYENDKERYGNLFRKNSTKNKNIWHIHGDCDFCDSIVLGYEHYIDYLYEIKDYLREYSNSDKNIRKPKGIFIKKSPIINLIPDFENQKEHPHIVKTSWVDYFLRDDVHITGFSLDYSEIDIWWLILKKEECKRILLETDFNYIGDTYYYYFVKKNLNTSSEVENNFIKKEQAKASLLSSYGVHVIPIELDDIEDKNEMYKSGHDKIIEKIKDYSNKPVAPYKRDRVYTTVRSR